MAPVFLALPSELQGRFYVERGLEDRARAKGLSPKAWDASPSRNITLVASFRDLKAARAVSRLVVLSEHGAGQSYKGARSGSYIGAKDRAGAIAVLVPGRLQAARHEGVHPAIPAYPIGLPKFDPWHKKPPPFPKYRIALSFHWDCKVVPETRNALRHYRPAFRELAQTFDLVGHAHPRIARQLEEIYGKYEIPFVSDFDELIEQAHVYVCDNSSTIYEWASLDRPVVLLNAPWYRREVEHGLRFWSHSDVGVQADQPKDLIPVIKRALSDPPAIKERRRQVIKEVYGATDGRASKRAAKALQEIHTDWS